MSAALTSGPAIFDARDEPGYAASAALAAAVHVVLALLLLFGVSWQNRAPVSVFVELWEPPPSAPDASEVPPPARVAEPALEPPPVRPEIVERAKPAPRSPPKAQAKPAPKVEAKAPPKAAPPPDDTLRRRMQEEAAREQLALNAQRERERVKELLARDAAGARERGLASWMDKVSAKVRSNVIEVPNVSGNPEAIFEVTQLPNGEVLDVKLRKSSGNRLLDEAIERAILKSSPLPRPDRPELFERRFNLSYRPKQL
jgi:colicin import membrane protein